jgi:antitoxin PrlF
MLYSTVTAHSQTTIPSSVREALGIEPGDKIEYSIEGDRAVIRRVVDDPDEDPVLGAFLGLLEREMTAHPERLQPITTELMDRMHRVSDPDIDIDEEIEGPVAI